MNIKLYNAKILTLEENKEIFNGEIWISESEIIYCGKSGKQSDIELDIKKESIEWDREIDIKGNLVMPGFKNAHTHSGMTFLRSYADDLPLKDWLEHMVFPAEAKLSPEDIYYFSVLANMEYLSSGITSNFDMYLNTESVANAAVDSGFRTVMCGALNDFSQSLEKLEEDYLKYNEKNSLCSFILGFHAEYTTGKVNLEQIAKLSQKYQAPVYMHNSETQFEVEECKKRYGMTPTELFEQLGMYEFGGGGFHCVHFSERDIEIFKNKKLSVVTNPSSNIKLASGVAPIQKYIEAGINIAIGTDGPASNNALDMFREMFLTSGLGKWQADDASAVDALSVLKMATLGGSKALGLDQCMTLSKGQKADLIVVDLNRPNMQPVNHVRKNLVYSGSKENIAMTMVNGKVLYENRKFHIGFSEEEIYKEVNRRKEKLLDTF